MIRAQIIRYFCLCHIVNKIAEDKQKYTQKGGVRPFGVSMFFGGFLDG